MADGRFARLVPAVRGRWAALKQRYRWLRRVVAAWQLMQRNNGNQYAAAITYFSFLALFPLLLLAVSITGFVLHAHPGTEQSLFAHVSEKIPGAFGKTVKTWLRTAIANRGGVGIVGLAGVLLTGLGWIGNLRGAIDAVWGRPPAALNFLKARVSNLVVLAGLGLGVVVSLALTIVGTAVTDQILSAVGLDDVPGAHYLLKLLGIAIAVAGDLAIFWWLLIRLPQADPPEGVAIRAALLASVGFEVLKIVGTYTVANTASSPTAGPFAGVIAILVWIQLVARWLLFCCAWAATLTAERATSETRDAHAQPAADAAPEPDREAAGLSPAAVGASLVGAGAVVGAVATAATLTAARRVPARR